MPSLTARVYKHSHPLSFLLFIIVSSFPSVVSLELLRFTRLRYLLHFIYILLFVLITCTVAFPLTGNTVVSLELLCSTCLSIFSYTSSIADMDIVRDILYTLQPVHRVKQYFNGLIKVIRGKGHYPMTFFVLLHGALCCESM